MCGLTLAPLTCRTAAGSYGADRGGASANRRCDQECGETEGVRNMRPLLVENYAPVETLCMRDVPSPTISHGFVRVRVKAAGIGFVEVLKIAGRYQTKDPLPFVPGTEFAGVVEEVGAEVSRLVPGNRVFGFASRGALAEEISVPASELSRIPDHLSFAQA